VSPDSDETEDVKLNTFKVALLFGSVFILIENNK
jgi:hypothetical protein